MIKLTDKFINELDIQGNRLRRENAYLRQLLNLDLHAPLVMPEEKIIDAKDVKLLLHF